jgi:hypothetical protein
VSFSIGERSERETRLRNSSIKRLSITDKLTLFSVLAPALDPNWSFRGAAAHRLLRMCALLSADLG